MNTKVAKSLIGFGLVALFLSGCESASSSSTTDYATSDTTTAVTYVSPNPIYFAQTATSLTAKSAFGNFRSAYSDSGTAYLFSPLNFWYGFFLNNSGLESNLSSNIA